MKGQRNDMRLKLTPDSLRGVPHDHICIIFQLLNSPCFILYRDMAPLPLPETSRPTPAGYLAAIASSSTDAPPSTSWTLPSAESSRRAVELLSVIQRNQGTAFGAWLQRALRGRGRNEAMYSTIRRLCTHTLSLQDQVRTLKSCQVELISDERPRFCIHRQISNWRSMARSRWTYRSPSTRTAIRTIRRRRGNSPSNGPVVQIRFHDLDRSYQMPQMSERNSILGHGESNIKRTGDGRGQSGIACLCELSDRTEVYEVESAGRITPDEGGEVW